MTISMFNLETRQYREAKIGRGCLGLCRVRAFKVAAASSVRAPNFHPAGWRLRLHRRQRAQQLPFSAARILVPQVVVAASVKAVKERIQLLDPLIPIRTSILPPSQTEPATAVPTLNIVQGRQAHSPTAAGAALQALAQHMQLELYTRFPMLIKFTITDSHTSIIHRICIHRPWTKRTRILSPHHQRSVLSAW